MTSIAERKMTRIAEPKLVGFCRTLPAPPRAVGNCLARVGSRTPLGVAGRVVAPTVTYAEEHALPALPQLWSDARQARPHRLDRPLPALPAPAAGLDSLARLGWAARQARLGGGRAAGVGAIPGRPI